MKIHNWTHFGGVLIAICAALALIVIPGIAIYQKSKREVSDCKVEILYKQIPDSIAIDSKYYFSRSQVDSIIKTFEYHEAVMDNKYQTLLSQKAEEAWIKDLFVYVFGIVVAVLGFFGYRSFTDLEEKTIESANTKAKETANATVPGITVKKVTEECDKKIPTEVNNYLKANLKKQVSDKIEDYFKGEGLDAIKTEVRTEVIRQIALRIPSDNRANQSECVTNAENNIDNRQQERTVDNLDEQVQDDSEAQTHNNRNGAIEVGEENIAEMM